jgi:hypothetical protein
MDSQQVTTGCLLPLSGSGVGAEVAVRDVGQPPFEAALGFLRVLPGATLRRKYARPVVSCRSWTIAAMCRTWFICQFPVRDC